MPIYEHECNRCGDRQTVIASITEYDKMTLKDKPCRGTFQPLDPDRVREICTGFYEHTYEDRNGMFSFKGGPPTPKFHRGGNQG